MYIDPIDDHQLCFEILHHLSVEIPERPVGSSGNLAATEYFRNVIEEWGWEVTSTEFPAVDWQPGSASLKTGDGLEVKPHISPYSKGAVVKAPLVGISSLDEIPGQDITGKIVLLHGDIAREQIMPKHFLFYNPDHHRELISVLEQKAPAALITASGRNSSLGSGNYPFPMFEDGDFNIPSLYLSDDAGKVLLNYIGQEVQFQSESARIPSFGFQVFASRGAPGHPRIVISAHIDAKKGTPGALDNASGITVLLLMAKSLEDYNGQFRIEILPINGEDYYAAPGEMVFLKENQGRLDEIVLNINIDGVGFHLGETALSCYGVDEKLQKHIEAVISPYPDMKMGVPWYQGDHTMFIQRGIPAVAVTSAWFQDNPGQQNITHTPDDTMSILDQEKIITTAQVLTEICTTFGVQEA